LGVFFILNTKFDKIYNFVVLFNQPFDIDDKGLRRKEGADEAE